MGSSTLPNVKGLERYSNHSFALLPTAQFEDIQRLIQMIRSSSGDDFNPSEQNIHTWELTYPQTKGTFESMTFLFSRLDVRMVS